MLQTFFAKSKTLTVASAAMALFVASGSTWATTPTPLEPVVEDLTGCLHSKNGRLRRLSEGGAPLKNKCNKKERIVTLDVVGPNEVEPFAFALDDMESVTIVKSPTDDTSFSIECAPDSVMLSTVGTIIYGALVPPVELVGLTSENDLPVLLDGDSVVYSLHNIRAFWNATAMECVVTGVVQHSPLVDVVP